MEETDGWIRDKEKLGELGFPELEPILKMKGQLFIGWIYRVGAKVLYAEHVRVIGPKIYWDPHYSSASMVEEIATALSGVIVWIPINDWDHGEWGLGP